MFNVIIIMTIGIIIGALLHDLFLARQFFAQPKVISITQPTELGTLYTLKEVKELADYAHKNNMLLHVDGARLSNAAASLNKSLKDIIIRAKRMQGFHVFDRPGYDTHGVPIENKVENGFSGFSSDGMSNICCIFSILARVS